MTRALALLSLTVWLSCGLSSGGPSPDDVAPASPPESVDLSPEEFTGKMAEEDVVILDVRTPQEVAGGKISGALEMDYRDPAFAERIAELDRDKTYLVYCASGGRSSRTCDLMAEHDFERVYNLEGGYSAWEER